MTEYQFQEMKVYIEGIVSHVLFEYNGKNCGVDPFNAHYFDMWYGDTFMEAKSVDEVFSTPFFDGKSLSEIFPDVQDLEPDFLD